MMTDSTHQISVNDGGVVGKKMVQKEEICVDSHQRPTHTKHTMTPQRNTVD